MSQPPARPQIYHITHVDNLAAIVADDALYPDTTMLSRGGPAAPIGMSTIKQRRLSLPVACHPGQTVGEYVPFYFCPRSIMLYVIYRGNNPELAYRGGQEPIVHLQADLHEVVAWATGANRRWAFSLSNAGAVYTQFRSSLAALDEINWQAVAATDFRQPAVKEGKQAEFLLHGPFPWSLITRIGVYSNHIRSQVERALRSAHHRPTIEVRRGWYY